MDNLTTHFGENLETIRKNNGLTQKQMADSIGVKDAVYSQYKHNQSFPRLKTLTQLVDLYKVDIHQMIFTKGYGDPELEGLTLAAEEAAQYAEDFKSLRKVIFERLDDIQKQIDAIKSQSQSA